MQSILKVRGIDRLSQPELRALIACAESLGFDPDWLACVIAFETGGSFSPSQRNKWAEANAAKKGAVYSGAIGLIQFMPNTAKNLGTSSAALAKMTFIEQLEYVKRYLKSYAARIKSLEDCYLAVFYPAAIGRSDEWVVGDRNVNGFSAKVYQQNAGFDVNKDGLVTKGEICRTIRAVRDAAKGVRLEVVASKPPVPQPAEQPEPEQPASAPFPERPQVTESPAPKPVPNWLKFLQDLLAKFLHRKQHVV